MARPRPYGIALLGAGQIAPTHCAAVRRLPGARLVAVCGRSREKAEGLAREWEIPFVTTDLRELLERPEVEVVDVVTWSGAHAEHGILAAEAGKHVIITKPVDIRLARIDALIAACRRSGVRLGAVHQFRGYPAYRRLHRAIADDRLGRLLMGNAVVQWWRGQGYYDSAEWRGTWSLDGGGALMNQAIHYVDLLLWLLGPPESVCGHIATQAHSIEVEDCASASVRWRSGALGTIQAATCIRGGFPARLEVHGERGNVVVEGDQVTLWDVEGEPVERGSAGGGSFADPRAGLEDAVTAHAEQIGDLLAAIEEDREPRLNGPEARRAVELVLGIYQSAWTGEAVRFPLARDPEPPFAPPAGSGREA